MYIIHCMIEIECTTKKWGNSVACILPSEVVRNRHIKSNQKILLILEDQPSVLSETFGILKDWKKPTSKIMREVDKELWND